MMALAVALMLAMVVGLWSLWALGTTGVPVVASTEAVREAALDALQLRPGDTFVDLGCGFGGVILAARRRRVRAYGYELNLAVWFVTWARNLADWGAHIRLGDSRKSRLGRADAIYAYLMPHAMRQLADPLGRLRPGTRVASVSFPVPGWSPERTIEVGLRKEPIYLYVIGQHLAATP
jgi:hypothetical protein